MCDVCAYAPGHQSVNFLVYACGGKRVPLLPFQHGSALNAEMQCRQDGDRVSIACACSFVVRGCNEC